MAKPKTKAKTPPTPEKPANLPPPSLNLLDTSLITVRTPGGVTTMSLPELYAALVRDNVDDLYYIRPHQRHPIHSTLCQIGTVAMVNAGLTKAPDNPEAWQEMLSSLTTQEHPGDEPWHLVVPNMKDPAFMQAPAGSENKFKEYSKVLATPDTLDITVGSKRHDVKDGVVRHSRAEHWLYALITCQAASGFDGSRLYGSSRMNSGCGNRHGFSVTPNTRWGAHVVRDMNLLAEKYQGENVTQHLLWTRKWDGTTSETLNLKDLQPTALYVEACKRLRLIAGTRAATGAGGISHALRATSDAIRINSSETKGDTQDPWTLTEAGKAVTITDNGFGFRQISQFLEPERFILPELASPRESDGSTVSLVARTMVQGQCETQGYYEQEIPLTRYTTSILRTPDGRQILGTECTERRECVRDVSSILRHAVKTYLQNGVSTGKTKKEHQKTIDHQSQRLQRTIEVDFWQQLQDGLESEEPKAAQAKWVHSSLIPRARKILESVQKTSLCNTRDRFKATAKSGDLFNRRTTISKKLPKRPEIKGEASEPSNGPGNEPNNVPSNGPSNGPGNEPSNGPGNGASNRPTKKPGKPQTNRT